MAKALSAVNQAEATPLIQGEKYLLTKMYNHFDTWSKDIANRLKHLLPVQASSAASSSSLPEQSYSESDAEFENDELDRNGNDEPFLCDEEEHMEIDHVILTADQIIDEVDGPFDINIL